MKRLPSDTSGSRIRPLTNVESLKSGEHGFIGGQVHRQIVVRSREGVHFPLDGKSGNTHPDRTYVATRVGRQSKTEIVRRHATGQWEQTNDNSRPIANDENANDFLVQRREKLFKPTGVGVA